MTINTKNLEKVLDYDNLNLKDINSKMHHLTGVRNFFGNSNDISIWKEWIESGKITKGAKEYGDYQTPGDLSDRVCKVLLNENVNPSTVIEPTFGIGNFIISALKFFKNIKEIFGVEIQPNYVLEFKKKLLNMDSNLKNKSSEITVVNEDFFKAKIPFPAQEIEGDLLVLGNPPWVTVAELAKLNSSNIPAKSNVKGLSGLDAKLGRSNFDIAEFIIIKLLDSINERGNGTLAMLCKNSTAKNIVESVKRSNWNITTMKMFNFDAKKEFNVATEASLFLVKIGEVSKEKVNTCMVYELDRPKEEIREFGWVDNKFVSDVECYNKVKNIDNKSPLIWRSGVKHDASKIFELTYNDNGELINGYKKIVDVEDTLLFSLLKSSDLNKNYIPKNFRRKVIITQKRTGEDTTIIEKISPKLWNYLTGFKDKLDKRGSSIYKKRPSFSIFGIGAYSFSFYKVAIAGMYKSPKFTLVLPNNNKPVMLDDTCNFLSFSKYEDAVFTFLILNSEIVQSLLKSVVFIDSQRPYTIEVLKRIDILQVAKKLSYCDLVKISDKNNFALTKHLNEKAYTDYKNKLLYGNSIFITEEETDITEQLFFNI